MEAYPKPRAQYIYNPRYGQRGVLTYAGQQANGAPPTGVIPNGSVGVGYYGAGIGGVGVVAGGYYPGVYYPSRSVHPISRYNSGYYPGAYYNSYSPYTSYAPLGGYYNYNMYGSLYPLANFYSPYQRSHYNTMPTYGYAGHYGYGLPAMQAHVYPPGPTTTTTTYTVMNGHSAPTTTHCHHPSAPAPVTMREDYQTENRRAAAERGAHSARPIKPADARSDDPFWCRERNGEWHLRSYYQIENECYPGTWRMDAEVGFLVFERT